MQRVLRLCAATGFLLLAPIAAKAQSIDRSAKAQEDFALAVATAHSRTSLFGAGSMPFAINATIVSSLALRGTGKGTYENQWVDAQHWHRKINFPDFQQSEMRNDSGHSWVDQSTDAMPLRIAEMLRVVVVHVPGSNTASSIQVSKTSMTDDRGEALTCYSSTLPIPADGFPRRTRWCFKDATGLLVSQEMPLNTHIVYSGYIAFQGKHEFTHVRVTSGGLTVLDIEIQYTPLNPHALDGSAPYATMHRSGSAGSTPNPEELGTGTVEYRFSPPLPSGTPDGNKKQPVQVQFQIGTDNSVLDACVEDAPTQDMAEAALDASRKFTFTPLTINGKAVVSRFYNSVWFRTSADDVPSRNAARGPDAAAPIAPSRDQSRGIYRSEEPAFAFRYPAGFDIVPRGQLEQDRHSGKGSQDYGFDPGAQCTTLLFKAQRLRPSQRTPEVVSITDLAPACVFGLLDRKAPETVALSAARSLVAQMANGSVAKPKRYTVNGRTFAAVSVSGTARRSASPEKLDALVAVTIIREHVVGWMILGPGGKDGLAETLAECTLQIGEEKESSIFPISK